MNFLRQIPSVTIFPKIANNVKSAQFSLSSAVFNKGTTSDSESKSDIPAESPNQWISIYQFPYIHAIAGLNKIKIYQAGFTSGGIPLSMFMESANVIPLGSANVFAVIGEKLCFLNMFF